MYNLHRHVPFFPPPHSPSRRDPWLRFSIFPVLLLSPVPCRLMVHPDSLGLLPPPAYGGFSLSFFSWPCTDCLHCQVLTQGTVRRTWRLLSFLRCKKPPSIRFWAASDFISALAIYPFFLFFSLLTTLAFTIRILFTPMSPSIPPKTVFFLIVFFFLFPRARRDLFLAAFFAFSCYRYLSFLILFCCFALYFFLPAPCLIFNDPLRVEHLQQP